MSAARRSRAVALLAAFAVAAGAVSLPAADPQPPEAPGRVADIPQVSYRPPGGLRTRPVRRAADLLQLLWAGLGTWSGTSARPRTLAAGVSLHALPWPAPEAAGLAIRTIADLVEETTLSLELGNGVGWCTPSLQLQPESRLRLEALAVEPEGAARLRVEWQPASGASTVTTASAAAAGAVSLPSLDLPLPAGHGRLCLRADGGAVSVGEPRIVVPEPAGSDPRPRWMVLAIVDALRGDLLSQDAAARLAPALLALSRRGQRYDAAISPGAHTQAALWPLLTGRDLARIDPVRARRFTPAGTPLGLVYTRGNLAVSHLAQAAGYHPVFLGNNSFLHDAPLFARFSNRGRPDTGTLDTINALPDLFRRYADERVFLVFYVSTPHGYSSAPRRLFDALGCGALGGTAAARCTYDARVAHADEAIAALQQGLADAGLAADTLQVLTADHGEVFGDGRKLETELYGKWWSLEEGHGGATHWNEIHVPLVVAGPGLAPGAWSGRVSTLDVVPTLAALGGFPAASRLDGGVLPLTGGRREPPARIVSQGYCSHSVLDGPQQLVWWEAECARRREPDSLRPATSRAELWRQSTLAATDESDGERLAPLVRRHLEWLAERLPGEAWLIDASRLGPAQVRVTALEGRIADWGPAGGPGSLSDLRAVLDPDERQLRIDVRGEPGPFFVSTWPKAARVRFDVDTGGRSAPTTLVGGLQLPLALAGSVADPRERPELWLADAEPARPAAAGPQLRVWRQAYRQAPGAAASRALTELDRVLREWGYIR